MSEPIDWLPDGTPFNPRFGDRYHSHTGLAQAREVFLRGCGLPGAWAGQAMWRVLETGFGCGLNFLATWAAWRADPARPRLLHFVSCEAFPVSADDLLRSMQGHGELEPLARALHAQYWGLLPGVHRLAFEGGQVLLTLYIGDAQAMLRQQQPVADAVYLDGFSPQVNPELWDVHTLKAVARCCRRGTRLATWSVAGAVREGLAQCGFRVQKVPGLPPKRSNLQAEFDPAWGAAPRAAGAARRARGGRTVERAGHRRRAVGRRRGGEPRAARLAGAGAGPGRGTRGRRLSLPAGVFAPHVSPDDSLLSRLSRCGVRATLQALEASGLSEGEDWSACGVLEHEGGWQAPPAACLGRGCRGGRRMEPPRRCRGAGGRWPARSHRRLLACAWRMAAAGPAGARAAGAPWHPLAGPQCRGTAGARGRSRWRHALAGIWQRRHGARRSAPRGGGRWLRQPPLATRPLPDPSAARPG